MALTSRSAIFLDKDGTLIKNVAYNIDINLVSFETGAIDFLRQMKQAGFLVIIVSNQSGVARGCFNEDQLRAAVSLLLKKIQIEAGVDLDGFYYCPHHPSGSQAGYAVECACRKPAPGLLLRAAHEHKIDLTSSWMVGDILNDVEAGRRAGCRTVLIDNGNETEWQAGPFRQPDFQVSSLTGAANQILNVMLTQGKSHSPLMPQPENRSN